MHLNLLTLAGGAAVIAGLLWGIKSLSILLADVQPAYTFEVAPFFFGIASFGLVAKLESIRPGPARFARLLAWVSTLAGLAAALIYLSFGDVGAFGLCAMVALLAVIALLLSKGRALREWSVIPWSLGWLTIGAIPVGGALSEIDERLLELPLLALALTWIFLGLRLVRDSTTIDNVNRSVG